MDNKLIILFFASVILSGVHSVNVKQNHDSITVREGDSYDLLCEALDAEVKACAFITPYGKTYVLWTGANYENGRVKQQGDKSGQCGLTVSKAKDTDNGKWQCNLSVQGQGGNAIAETRDVTVTVAVPPKKVALKILKNFSPTFYNVKMKQGKKKEELLVDCIAEQARPKPTFEWWLGGEPLKGDRTPKEENLKAGKADYIDTLKYYPSENHDGKKLRCQVTHQAYSEVQKKDKVNEAEVLLKIQYAPVPAKKVETHYNLNLGKANPIRMAFNANPKPSEGYWTINNTKVQIGTKSKDGKYSSGMLTVKDGVQGQWLVELTIKDLTADDTKGTHKLTIKNEEGETSYDFKLALGKQPPPAADSNSLTVGIIVIIVIIVLILVVVIVARAKGALCFAAKGGDELDEEKEAFENVEKGESNAIVQDSKPVGDTNLNKTPEKKLEHEVDTKAEKEEKKSNGAHTPV